MSSSVAAAAAVAAVGVGVGVVVALDGVCNADANDFSLCLFVVEYSTMDA